MVVVGFPPVDEGLLVLAAAPVYLVVAGPHGVEDVLAPRSQVDQGVGGELRHVLLALRPGPLHAVRRDVRRGVQGPLEVGPDGERVFAAARGEQA